MRNTHPTESEESLANYWAKAATRTGKAELIARARFKRFVLWAVIHFALFIKRALDIVVSAIALVALSPVYAATALLIKLEDGGAVFFRQKRVGRRGKSFFIWKFRSMVINAEEVSRRMIEERKFSDTVAMKLQGDPRITKIGRVIRKYSIDELPQFWNVFRGDMAIVGPRPVVLAEVAKYTNDERQRLLAKPGLTCFWQVGGRTDLDFDNQVKLDVEYIRSTNIWLDIKLLLLTVPAVLFGRGAY